MKNAKMGMRNLRLDLAIYAAPKRAMAEIGVTFGGCGISRESAAKTIILDITTNEVR